MSASKAKALRINHISWGKMEIEGVGAGKDFKLYPGGGHAWDWNATGTRHVPGTQPADVEELIAKGCTVIVLSRGMDLVLQVCPETLALLEQRGITAYVAETRAAVAHYNSLVEQGVRVGGLFHSTCQAWHFSRSWLTTILHFNFLIFKQERRKSGRLFITGGWRRISKR